MDIAYLHIVTHGKTRRKNRYTEFYGGAAEIDDEKDNEESDAETGTEPDKKDAGGEKGSRRQKIKKAENFLRLFYR